MFHMLLDKNYIVIGYFNISSRWEADKQSNILLGQKLKNFQYYDQNFMFRARDHNRLFFHTDRAKTERTLFR